MPDMPEFKTDTDIFNYAINREIASYTLYEQLASQTNKSEIRKLLYEMAAEERQHKAKLELELMKLGQVVPDAEAQAEIEQEEISTAKTTDPATPEDFEAIIALAMEREHLALHTYISLAADINNNFARETLLAIAEEEAQHYAKLRIEYDMFQSYHQ